MCGGTGKLNPASSPALVTILRILWSVKGDLRSLMNSQGECSSSCKRSNCRSNQISRLTIAEFQAICQGRNGLPFNNKLSQQTEAKSWDKNHEPNSSKNTFKTLELCRNAYCKDGQCQEPQEENPSISLQSLTRQQSSKMLSTASETI